MLMEVKFKWDYDKEIRQTGERECFSTNCEDYVIMIVLFMDRELKNGHRCGVVN